MSMLDLKSKYVFSFFFLIDGFLLLSSLASERPSLSLYSSNLQL